MRKGCRALDKIEKINKNSVIPIYYQLLQYMKRQIKNGIWKENDVIPSERELCEQFSISRMTVRQAVDALKNEGLVYTQRGVGTFIGKSKLDQGLSKLSSFTEDMQQRGMKAGSKTLQLKMEQAPEEVADFLGIANGDKVIVLKRLRLANGEPMALEEAYLVYDLAPTLLECYHDGDSLYETLDKKCGIRILKAHQTIEIDRCDKKTAKLLCISHNDPVFKIRRIGKIEKNRPIEFVRSLYRADKYVFTVNLEI